MKDQRIISEAREVAARLISTKLPAHTANEYGLAEVSWAEQVAKPSEAVQDAHARLVAKQAPILRALRVAGGVARMLEGNGDPRPLLSALGFKPGEDDVPNAADDYESRLHVWQGACELAELAREEHELVGDALRRLVEENGAIMSAFHYVTSERRGW